MSSRASSTSSLRHIIPIIGLWRAPLRSRNSCQTTQSAIAGLIQATDAEALFPQRVRGVVNSESNLTDAFALQMRYVSSWSQSCVSLVARTSNDPSTASIVLLTRGTGGLSLDSDIARSSTAGARKRNLAVRTFVRQYSAITTRQSRIAVPNIGCSCASRWLIPAWETAACRMSMSSRNANNP